jgi:hypothetical protein
MEKWFYQIGGKANGPVSVDQLRELVHAKQVLPKTLVKSTNYDSWIHAQQIIGLFTYPENTQNKLPPKPSVAGNRPHGEEERQVQRVRESVKDTNQIDQQLVAEAIQRYEIARRSGTAIDAAAHASLVAMTYLNMADEVNYKKWKAIEQQEAARAAGAIPSGSVGQCPACGSMNTFDVVAESRKTDGFFGALGARLGSRVGGQGRFRCNNCGHTWEFGTHM